MNNSGPLDFEADIDDSFFNRKIDEMQRRILGFGTYVTNETGRIDKGFKGISQSAVHFTTQLSDVPGKMSKARSEVRAFDGALGSIRGLPPTLNRQISDAQRGFEGYSRTVRSENDRIGQSFKMMSQLAAGYLTFASLQQLPGEIIKVRGQYQQLEIAFTTMLSSKTKADALLADVAQFAAKTPYGLSDTAQGAKQLLAYGEQAEKIIPTLTKLGDIASGIGAPLNDIVYLYGTTMTQGRLYTQDLNQFTGRGIPMIRELAKQFGVAESKVRDLVEQGKVGFPEVQKVIDNLTKSGSMFGGLMEAQSKSLTGLTAQLSDAWKGMLNEIGKSNEGILASGIGAAATLVENYEKVIDVLKVMVATYGAYRTAVLALVVVEQVRAAMTTVDTIQKFNGASMVAVQVTRQLTVAQAAQVVVSQAATRAQTALNASILANPYVLAATLLTGLITAVVVFRNEATQAEKVQERLSEAMNRATEQASSEIAKIEVLKTQINNENLSRDERNKKLQDLIRLSPEHLKALTLENVATADGTTALNTYIEALKRKLEMQEIEKELTDSINRQRAAREGKNDLPILERLKLGLTQTGSITGVPNANRNFGAETADATRKYNDQIVKDEDLIQSKLKERVKTISEVGKSTAVAEGGNQKAVAKTVEWYDAQIKSLKEQQSQSATSRAEFDKYQKQIDALEKSRNRLTGQKTKAEKDAEKVGPMGSLSYWENVAKKAQEVIDKTPDSNKGVLARQNAIKLDAERKAAAIRKTLEVKTFEEELAEKKKQYELYTKWVEFVDKHSADERFSELLKSGNTYADYLKSEISKLKSLEDEGTISVEGSKNLVSLNIQYQEATGAKTAIDLFRESLTRAKDEAKNLTDYLAELKAKQDTLEGDTTDYGFEARKTLAEEINNTEKQRKEQLAQFLNQVLGSEEQRLAVSKRYADLRAVLEKKFNTDRGADYQKALSAINKAEKQEYDDLAIQQAEASQAFKDLNKVIDAQGREALRIRITRLKAYLKELESTVGKESELFKQTAKEIKDLGFDLKRETLDDYRVFASLAGDLGEALSQVNGGLGETGRLLSGISSQANLVTIAFDESASKTDKMAAGISGVIGLIDIIASSSRQRKQAEEEYYRSVIAQQQQYNILLNDQVGLQSELNESVFVKDFQGRLQDGIAKLNDANKGYQEAIDKLTNGRAKTGQKNAIDAGAIGKGIGAGAAAGAAIGTIVPGIGNVVGGVVGGIVGGIVGLFGGKKKKDEWGSLLEMYPDLVKEAADGWEELDEELAQTLIDQNLVDENTKQLLQNTIEWMQQIEEAKEQVKSVVSELAGSLGNTLRDSLVTAFKEGTDAAQAFGDSVSKILEDMLSQLIFNQVFSASFKKLQDEMIASYGPTGDGSWIDDFGRFFGEADELWKQFYAGLEAAQSAAGAYGMDIFKKSNTGKDAANTALSGAIKGVSEETASVLAGQMNAIRINGAETLFTMKNALTQLTEIAVYSRYMRFLEGIDAKLGSIQSSDPLRSKGITG
ncbi:tape measure protein [Siphonobacter sp. SORGH_AS_1065]|uniref:tape measure protein n=1 Tax=Siphonobacter sp. SORGH_AS_1065 TaxID=3041795 RepID=UPI0027835BED|nr:tape measure protein [Siphonobacter sp. SORGH_AS_1065]MDQ1088559.1 tape measure domain-containing protein [Siphonobacter sp. SORGH_AS_1065]